MSEQMQTYQPKKLTFSQIINAPAWQKSISATIRNPAKRDQFVTAIVSAVTVNPALQECTPASIISGALQGAALGLSPSPQMGQYYLIPFDCKLKDANGKNLYQTDENGNKVKDANGRWIPVTEKRANFIVGYKGYIQLALRSGEYLDLDARPVVEGEYLGRDPFTGRPKFQWIEDDSERENRPVIGYFAFFELLNGFRKVLYWSREQMISHADRFSPAFHKDAVKGKYANQSRVSFEDYLAGNYPQQDEWKYSSFWYKDFNVMAIKTMLRQLITKWGPVSMEMEKATELDSRNTQMVEATDDDLLAASALPPSPAASALPAGSEHEPEEEAQEDAVDTQGEEPREESTEEAPPVGEQAPPPDQSQAGQVRMGFGDLL